MKVPVLALLLPCWLTLKKVFNLTGFQCIPLKMGKWTRGGAVGQKSWSFTEYYLFYDSIKLQLTEIYNHKVWKALLKLKKKKKPPYCGYSSASYFKHLKLGRINVPTHSLNHLLLHSSSESPWIFISRRSVTWKSRHIT